MSAAFTQHTAGALIEGVQRCVVCGLILIDYRGAYFLEGGDGIAKPSGWPMGPVSVRGNFSMAGTPLDETVIPCTP
jgi:hypothetical protein